MVNFCRLDEDTPSGLGMRTLRAGVELTCLGRNTSGDEGQVHGAGPPVSISSFHSIKFL